MIAADMILDAKSERLLQGVHPDLCSVVRRAREHCVFRLTEGLRTLARQKQLVADKKSRTLNSRHLTGHAIDFVDMAGSYDAAAMATIWKAFEAAGTELGVALTWGGNWVSFCDTPHVELSWHEYPASSFKARAKAIALGVGTGGGAVSIPQVPNGLSSGLSKIEEHIAIGGRVSSLAKGLFTFELTSLIGAAGILIMICFAFWPAGETNAGGSD